MPDLLYTFILYRCMELMQGYAVPMNIQTETSTPDFYHTLGLHPSFPVYR
jgi:hypothetical protein